MSPGAAKKVVIAAMRADQRPGNGGGMIARDVLPKIIENGPEFCVRQGRVPFMSKSGVKAHRSVA